MWRLSPTETPIEAITKQANPMDMDNTTGLTEPPISGNLGRGCGKARENGAGKAEMNMLAITALTAKMAGESSAGQTATSTAGNSART